MFWRFNLQEKLRLVGWERSRLSGKAQPSSLSSTGLFDSFFDQPPIHREPSPVSEEHADLRHDTSALLSSRRIRFKLIAYLHHEPIRHGVYPQLLIEDQKVEDGHPAKETDLEEDQ